MRETTKTLLEIMRSPQPSQGLKNFDFSVAIPELEILKGTATENGCTHKDNFLHTLKVVDNVAKITENELLRWAALFHDIGKTKTKRFDVENGWTFHNHEKVSAKMVKTIFDRLGIKLSEIDLEYVCKIVRLHMRPISLIENDVNDSAIRRLISEAGSDVEDLMILCRADVTSENAENVKKIDANYINVIQRINDVRDKDLINSFKSPISGKDIMNELGIEKSRYIGILKDAVKEAIFDGIIDNDYSQAFRYMLDEAKRLGITT